MFEPTVPSPAGPRSSSFVGHLKRRSCCPRASTSSHRPSGAAFTRPVQSAKRSPCKAFAPSWITRAFRSSACVSLPRCLGFRPGCSDMHSCRASPPIAASHAARHQEARRVVSCWVASALRRHNQPSVVREMISDQTARREPLSGPVPDVPQPTVQAPSSARATNSALIVLPSVIFPAMTAASTSAWLIETISRNSPSSSFCPSKYRSRAKKISMRSSE